MIHLSPPLDKMSFGCLSFNLTLIFMKNMSDSFGDDIGMFCTEILLAPAPFPPCFGINLKELLEDDACWKHSSVSF